jgi:hypothetical protein
VSANRRIIPTTVVSSLREKNWLVIAPDFHLLPESVLQDIRNDAEALENWLLNYHEEIGVDLENVAIEGLVPVNGLDIEEQTSLPIFTRRSRSHIGSFVAILSCTTWKSIRPKSFLNLYGMIDTTST